MDGQRLVDVSADEVIETALCTRNEDGRRLRLFCLQAQHGIGVRLAFGG